MDNQRFREDDPTDGHGNTALFRAVSSGDEALVRRLLIDGADVNHRSHRDETPLYYACESNQLSMARLLLEHGADCSRRPHTKSSLMAAARFGSRELVRTLLSRGASIDAGRTDSYSELHMAAFAGNEDAFFEMMETNPSCFGRPCSGGYTELHIAAWSGSTAMCRAIVQAKAALLDATDESRMTPLHYACTRPGNARVVRMLLSLGANPNADNLDRRKPIDMAVDSKAEDCARELVLAACHTTSTLLRLLMENSAGSIRRMHKLLEAGANPFSTENGLCFADQAAQHSKPIARFAFARNPALLTEGDASDGDGGRYAAFLSMFSRAESARVAIRLAPAHLPWRQDALPFARAAKLRTIVARLLGEGMDDPEHAILDARYDVRPGAPLAQTDKITLFAYKHKHRFKLRRKFHSRPIHTYAKHGRLDAIRACSRAECNARDVNQCTPLVMASGLGQLEAVRLLLAKGADVNAVNHRGRSSLYYATYHDQRAVFDELIAAGANLGNATHSSAVIYASISGLDPAGELFRRLVARGERYTMPEFARNVMEEDEQKAIQMMRDGFDGEIDDRFDKNYTLLHMAAQGGYTDVARFLIRELHADVHARDRYDLTPLDYAVEKGHEEMVRLLRGERRV